MWPGLEENSLFLNYHFGTLLAGQDQVSSTGCDNDEINLFNKEKLRCNNDFHKRMARHINSGKAHR